MRLGGIRDWLKKAGSALSFGRTLDEALLDELEETLITADVSPRLAESLVEDLRIEAKENRIREASDLRDLLKGRLIEMLGEPTPLREGPGRPSVWLFVGVNGAGKTTTIAKCAQMLKKRGKRCLVAAGDTFRAAAIEQLQIWADRVGAEMVRHQDGADPSAVIFDAIEAAKARGIDFVLADTAGRQHTKHNLMEELAKISRVTEKALGRPADEVVLVLDGAAGQNAIRQAEAFSKSAGVTGIALAKMDGASKGGAALSIVSDLGAPVKLIGTGESADDLQVFDATEFADALIGAD